MINLHLYNKRKNNTYYLEGVYIVNRRAGDIAEIYLEQTYLKMN